MRALPSTWRSRLMITATWPAGSRGCSSCHRTSAILPALTGLPAATASSRSAVRALRLPSSRSVNPSMARPSMTRTRNASPPPPTARNDTDRGRPGGGSGLRVVARAVPVDEHNPLVTDDPCVVSRGQRGDIAWMRLEFGAVGHPDVEHTGGVVLEVRGLAQLSAGDRLEVLRPPPAGLQREAAYHAAANVHQFEHPLLERAHLVGLRNGLLLSSDCRRHGSTSSWIL